MPESRQRRMVPRRRRDDEDEDETSLAGDLDEYSMSEGSAISNGDDEADVEGSDASVDEDETRVPVAGGKSSSAINRTQAAPTALDSVTTMGSSHGGVQTLSNGLNREIGVDFDKGLQDQGTKAASGPGPEETSSAPQLSHPQETPAERSKREHLEYVRQRDSNPAFVPNRGGFFLHDDRSVAQNSSYGRPYHRGGRGRGYNPGFGAGRGGYGQPISGPTDRPWAHDLHETVNKNMPSPSNKEFPTSVNIPTAKSAPNPPNRAFSVSTVLGNVTIQVFLPGMTTRKTFQNIVKKQHTLLPQHRPPLRRDKPVRISIPDEDPRYIFPSTERSFIFIPRAMRPNQQTYTRGRGRGSYHGSRRPSIMGSTYTPSVAMSRKSSFGGIGSTGMLTPTDGMIPRVPMMQNFNRPIVRMPVAPVPMFGMTGLPASIMTAPNASFSIEQQSNGPPMLHSPTVTLPMHQPRPQKTVSVAEIELPAVKAPQQQQEQPFHQQMPTGVSLANGPTIQQGQSQPHLNMAPPLSHIPEGAVYAQPFQPYQIYPQGGYYNPNFPGGAMVYHTPSDPYGMGIGGPVLPQQYNPTASFVPGMPTPEAGVRQGPMAHETHGMVYYYDPSQYLADGSHMTQYQNQTGVGNGMMGVPGAAPYFYPSMPGGMFYPAAQ